MDINWIEIFGWFGSGVLVISLLQTRVVRLRLINLLGSTLLGVYNLIIEVWPMVGLNIVLALINVVFLVKLFRTQHDTDEYTVIEVEPDDTYLLYLLDVHRHEIAQSDPGFAGPAADQATFIILRADETVGVVVIEDAGDGVAQVLLDWVTPRYQDLSPGEFVFRQSDVLTRRGFRRVLTSPDTRSPYYSRIGFAKEGDRYALDLT
ncbi:MAG: hypothetical protein WBG36_11495 [Ornithinimicrobium sp.]